jgi:hypothetical protein
MNLYEKIATIVIRGFALSYFTAALIEVALLVTDAFLVRAGVYYRLEFSLRYRLMVGTAHLVASLCLYAQSKAIVRYLVQGLEDEQKREPDDESDEIGDPGKPLPETNNHEQQPEK